MSNSQYSHAPVAAYDIAIEGSRIFGYAAPQSGGPCLLRLSSDDTPINFAVAGAYSEAAANQGIRSGWCGFELHGLRLAIALGERVEIACAVSGRILKAHNYNAEDMPPLSAVSRSLSVEELLSEIRGPRCCPSPEILLPFALNHYRRHGAQAFRDMAYLTLLGRWPDAAAPYPDERIAEDEKRILAYIDDLVSSEEFLSRWGGQLPGPFHPDFRLDTTGLL